MSEHHEHTHDQTNEEKLALLKYMAHHNAHHAEELEELISSLPESAAAEAKKAALLMRQAGDVLENAVKTMEG